MKARCISLILALIATSCAGATDDATIRVGLVRFYTRVGQVTLSSPTGLLVKDGGGTQLLSCEPTCSVTVSAQGNAITAKSDLEARTACGSPLAISPADAFSTVRITSPNRPSREYRGSVEVLSKAGALQLVNVIRLEDYLLGCVPEEMPSSYPAEAIKAQAIAARTFSLRNRDKHRSEGYDLCDTTNCQLYGGVQSEKPRSAEAVRATCGIVIAHDGRPASVMYSADCGGTTASGNAGTPYLCPVTEPEGIPHCTWEASFTVKEIGQKLGSAGVKGTGELVGVRVNKMDESGRVIDLTAATSTGAVSVSGQKFRSALGLKSQLFTLETQDAKIVIKGKGSGHGVGLCQAGARWLAGQPQNRTCREILAHYFPGTEIVQLGAPSDQAPQVAGVPEPSPEVRQPSLVKRSPSRKVRTENVPPPGHTAPPAIDVRLEAPEGISF